MNNYENFLKTKTKDFVSSGFEIDEKLLNNILFEFQRYIVKIALKKGRFAVFADCGLGKTLMQLEWANQVSKHTEKPVLILAPLAVTSQTIKEGKKFNINIDVVTVDENEYNEITNYEQLKNIDISKYTPEVQNEITQEVINKYFKNEFEKFDSINYRNILIKNNEREYLLLNVTDHTLSDFFSAELMKRILVENYY